MNKEDLINIAEETKLCVTTKTLVKLLKKDADKNPNTLGDIFKISAQDVVINRSYQQAVNEERSAEGKDADFVAKERNWKEMNQTNAVIDKEGVLYLSCIIDPDGRDFATTYVDSTGNIVEYETFAPFKSKSKSVSNQGVDNVVQARTFKFDSILDVEII